MTLLSGKFVLRLDPALHAELKQRAVKADLSLNEYCALQLAATPTKAELPHHRELDAAVAKALALHGDDLAGVAFYGSWVRGTATAASDVDMLIVLQRGIAVRRSLYRPWDDVTLMVQGLKVEPSIVAIPAESAPVSGFWAEIATEALVYWWADRSVHQYLSKVRQHIAAGGLRREQSHGQSYWVHRNEVA